MGSSGSYLLYFVGVDMGHSGEIPDLVAGIS